MTVLWDDDRASASLSVRVIDFTFDGTMTDCFVLPSCGKPTTRSERSRSVGNQKHNSIKLLPPVHIPKKFPNPNTPTQHPIPLNINNLPKTLFTFLNHSQNPNKVKQINLPPFLHSL